MFALPAGRTDARRRFANKPSANSATEGEGSGPRRPSPPVKHLHPPCRSIWDITYPSGWARTSENPGPAPPLKAASGRGEPDRRVRCSEGRYLLCPPGLLDPGDSTLESSLPGVRIDSKGQRKDGTMMARTANSYPYGRTLPTSFACSVNRMVRAPTGQSSTRMSGRPPRRDRLRSWWRGSGAAGVGMTRSPGGRRLVRLRGS